ncbi:MAG TPA: IclR family transcriptional regulator C-terminal domain-containing protein, partial [Baekduia sp.]|nr:IclR family transcriptional regulator C-terminal domain-containing protein [Baekduia sp.]
VRALVGARGPLVRRHDCGPQTPAELRRLLAEIRRAGHAEEDGFVTPGFASVAAPVLDHAGHPVAAVALTFPGAEVDAAGRVALAAEAVRAAAEVARRIHGRPMPRPSTQSR